MPTINTNRLSLVEYSSSNFGYIRSLACLSGICTNKFEGEDTFEVTLDSILTDSYLSYLKNFTNGFTLFVRLSGNDGIVSPSKTYTLKLKGSNASTFTNVGVVLITKETSFLSNDVLIMHQIDEGTFIISNRDLEIPCLSSSAHASNNAYTVLGIGATTNSSKFLRSDGTWQTPTNTTYGVLSASSHASGTGYLVNGIGATTNASSFLRSDGTWQTVSGTDELVKQETTQINKYFPILLSDNQLSKAGALPTDTTSKAYMARGVSVNANNGKIYASGFVNPGGGSSTNFWTTDGGTFSFETLATNAHASNASYVVKGSGYSSNPSKFLREDGSWQTVSGGSTYGTLSASSHASGTSYLVNGPGSSTNTFLRGDGSWQTPTNTTYKLLSTSNYSPSEGHVIKGPGGVYSQYITLLPDGSWGHLYDTFGTDGVEISKKYVIHGLDSSKSPMDPAELGQYFLCANGKWEIPAGGGGGGGTTYATLSSSAHASNVSYVIRGIGSSTNSSSYLRSDGSWQTPTNTTYGTFTTAANGLVPKPTSATATTNYVLAGNGTWVTMSGGGAVQAKGKYGASGGPLMGISIPTSQNRSNFPNVTTSYDGSAVVNSVLFPTKDDELIALPVEISKDGVIYIPVSAEFATQLERLGYELGKPKK